MQQENSKHKRVQLYASSHRGKIHRISFIPGEGWRTRCGREKSERTYTCQVSESGPQRYVTCQSCWTSVESQAKNEKTWRRRYDTRHPRVK
jgi:hypothetical protein